MPKFLYKGIHTSGIMQSGLVEADNRKSAAEAIYKMGYFPQKITEVIEKKKKGEIELSYKIKTSDLAIFCSQFSVVLKAGVPILKAIDILASQTDNKKLKLVLTDVYAKIQTGSSVSQAFNNHARRFPEIFISMLETGEISGNLELVLARMGASLTKEHKLSQKVKSAMMYPMVLSIVAVVVVIFLLVAVVPTFAGMYSSSGQELPFLTRMMLALGDFMAKNIIWIILFAATFAIVAKIILKTETVRFKIDLYKLKIPVFGKLIKKVIMARYTQNMATLLSSGISLTQAISITSKALGNSYVGKQVHLMINEVSSGRGLADSLSDIGVFSPMVVQMTRLGEESGSLDELLTQTADFYEAEAEAATAKLTALMEPIIIVIMGGMVLLIVLSILLPMFGMYSMVA